MIGFVLSLFAAWPAVNIGDVGCCERFRAPGRWKVVANGAPAVMATRMRMKLVFLSRVWRFMETSWRIMSLRHLPKCLRNRNRKSRWQVSVSSTQFFFTPLHCAWSLHPDVRISQKHISDVTMIAKSDWQVASGWTSCDKAYFDDEPTYCKPSDDLQKLACATRRHPIPQDIVYSSHSCPCLERRSPARVECQHQSWSSVLFTIIVLMATLCTELNRLRNMCSLADV